MGKSIHSLGNKPIIKYIYKAVKAWRQYGFASMLRMAGHRLRSASEAVADHTSCPIGDSYESLFVKYKTGEIRGIAIIPSAFEFDELYNQRTINLSKYLSRNGYGVIYVAWQWSKGDALEKNYQFVYKNVIQVPLYEFVEKHGRLKIFDELPDKKYIVMLPAKILCDLIFFMKDHFVDVYYDIMDDWERFFEAGQAPWFVKSVEESVILNSNKVTAVSQPLIDKFSYLRTDIALIGNGYYPDVLDGAANIAAQGSRDERRVVLGYFGHLTQSWFDWDLIFKLASQYEIYFEIIGYGESEAIRNKASKMENIKLLGKVNPRDLHKYASGWDIAIIPFKKSELSEAVDPIKIYEYLYFGLPTVATGIPHLKAYPYTTVAENEAESFYNATMALFESRSQGSVDYTKIKDFLSDKTWDKRFENMFKADFISELYTL